VARYCRPRHVEVFLTAAPCAGCYIMGVIVQQRLGRAMLVTSMITDDCWQHPSGS